VLKALARAGLRRGLLGGRPVWLWVGVTASALRLFRRLTKPPPRVVHKQELRAGDALVITASAPGGPEEGTP
jgi:hypothetical protein